LGFAVNLTTHASAAHLLEGDEDMKIMTRLFSIATGLLTFWPTLALAEEVEGTYRGIGSIYFTLIGAILIYGVYDSFGKRAAYIVGPLIVIGLYVMLPER